MEQPHQASSNTSPRVSVIIPTHNRSQLLRTAVQSVLAQTYPAIEIIVVDDGSTDDTAAVIAEYAGQVDCIKQANQGVSAARNTGFRASSGEYVNFLDDDDTFMPTKIERQVAVLEAQPEAGLVHCGYQHVDEEGTVLDTTGLLPEGNVLEELVRECFLTVHSPLIRRQCLAEVGLFDEDLGYGEEWELFLRIALAGYPFACVQEPLCAYRVHRASKMTHTLRLERETLAVLDRVFANPQLPAAVGASKDAVYSGVYLWAGCQHYAARRWEDGRRSLAEALALRPQLLTQPGELLNALYNQATSSRIRDPLAFLDGLFDHLPPQAEGLHRYRPRLAGRVTAALSLRSYAVGDIAEAKHRLTEAIGLYPPILGQTQGFLDMVCHQAMNPPVNAPRKYINTVFRNLPTGAERLKRLRSRALSQVNMGRAFRDCAAGRYPLALRGIIRTLGQRPAYVANRGALSILLRSLSGWLAERHGTKESAGKQAHLVPSDTSPRVSVIIPTHNRSQLLRITVESVLAQTYPAIEIIVVDDGSTDDTAAIVAEYAGRVTYIEQANTGVAAARNTGFRASSGEFINFLDDDDTFMPTKIERQVAVLDDRPEVGLVHCRHQHIDEAGTPLDAGWRLPEGNVLKELLCGCFLVVHAPLIRRQCLEQVGLFDETLPWTADWDLWLRIALAGYPFACVQEPLCTYRIQRGSMQGNVAKQEQAVLAMLEKVFANPQLPAEAAAIHAQACQAAHLWIGCRYYAVGQWEDGQRNLAEVLAQDPELIRQPERILRILYNHALDPRSDDPLRFASTVFDHLPPQASSLRPYRPRLVSSVTAALSLRAYAAGDIAEAKRQLTQAIALYPPILGQTQDFLDMVCHQAMSPPAKAPLKYIDTVFRNLPAGTERLGRLRSQALSEVSIGRAFRDYTAGRHPQVLQSLIRTLGQHPASLANKGVMSILLRSLFGLLTRKLSTKGLVSGTTAPGI
jgi:glycosyltransferase involved in cell wall biosynthesis